MRAKLEVAECIAEMVVTELQLEKIIQDDHEWTRVTPISCTEWKCINEVWIKQT